MAKQQFKSNDNVVFSCQYHVVFCPKYRRKVLNEPIAARLKEIVFELAVEHGQEVIELEVMLDHVNLLCAVSPQFGVAKWVRLVKGRTSRFLRMEFPELKRRLIGIEDLNVKGMSKNHRLSKSVLDAALGELRRQLEYKAIWNRVRLVKVSRWFPSSKMCGSCGALNDALTLSERTWPCACGADNHRDINAARNICKESLAVGHTERLNAHRESVSRATARSFR